MNKYKMVACDLDETLLNSDSTVSDENLNAVKSISQKGINFVYATGRALKEIPNKLNIPEVRFIIFSTGAAVYDRESGKTKYFSMCEETAKAVYDTFSKYRICMAWHQKGEFFGHPESYRNYKEHNVAQSVCQTFRELAKLEETVTSFDDMESFCTFFKDKEELKKCKAELEKIEGIVVIETWPFCVEVMSDKAGKDNGIRYVAETLGISLDEVISVGDSGNDVSSAEICGLSLAVSNACDKMKQVADKVICSNHEHVAKYILENILNK